MKIKGNKIIVVDSGGRGNAIAHTFSRSPRVSEVISVSGNAGSEMFGRRINMTREEKVRAKEFLADLAQREKADLIFVGPESYLSDGIADYFENRGLPIIGPSQKASALEGSKCRTKELLAELGIPVPPFANFTNADKARSYVRSLSYPVVVKADGLAAGKGALVCSTLEESENAINLLMEKAIFGDAGRRIDIEKRLYGRELSFFCFTDGQTVLPMEAAQDYKRARDNDEGNNTGGMGCYSPHPWLNDNLTKIIMEKVAAPTIHGIRDKFGIIYKGVIYFGLMLVEEAGEIKPYVLEINVRMGDPEAQAILPRLQTDIVDISESILENRLHKIKLQWDPGYRVCVVATSGKCKGSKGWYKGYPDRYKIDVPVSFREELDSNCLLFHSGTEIKKEQLVTTGGRVICVVSRGNTLAEARKKAYEEMDKIDFYGKYCRSDIGR